MNDDAQRWRDPLVPIQHANSGTADGKKHLMTPEIAATYGPADRKKVFAVKA
jgi:hypothetical protein